MLTAALVVLVVMVAGVIILAIIFADVYKDATLARERRIDVNQYLADFIPEVNRPDIHCTCPTWLTEVGAFEAGCPLHEGGNAR